MGKPCIRWPPVHRRTRGRLVAAGRDVERIREEFSFIEAEDVRQAMLYAADYLESTTVPRDMI